MKDKKVDEAEEKITEIENILGSIVVEDSDELTIKNARIFINEAEFIVNKYGWLIGKSAYEINNMKEELSKAVEKKDYDVIKDKTKKLQQELGKLLSSNKTLGLFIYYRMQINMYVQPVLPEESIDLIEELERVEDAVKNVRPDAKDKINKFNERLNSAVRKAKGLLDDLNKGIVCPVCGYENKHGSLRCGKCKADFKRLTGERTIASS